MKHCIKSYPLSRNQLKKKYKSFPFKLNFNKAHRDIQKLVKQLRWNFLPKKVNGLHQLTVFSTNFILDVLWGSECVSVKNKRLQQTSSSLPHFIRQWEIIHVFLHFGDIIITSQPAFTCTNSTMETPKQYMKSVQS